MFLSGSVYGACTATIAGPPFQNNQGQSVIPLHFSYGTGQTYDVSDFVPLGAPGTQLGDFVYSTCNQLESQQIAFSSATAIGTQVTPNTPPGPSVDLFAVQKTSFSATVFQYRQLQWAVDNGLITSSDPSYIAAKNTATSLFTTNKSTFVAAGLVPLKQ